MKVLTGQGLGSLGRTHSRARSSGPSPVLSRSPRTDTSTSTLRGSLTTHTLREQGCCARLFPLLPRDTVAPLWWAHCPPKNQLKPLQSSGLGHHFWPVQPERNLKDRRGWTRRELVGAGAGVGVSRDQAASPQSPQMPGPGLRLSHTGQGVLTQGSQHCP